jgi:hypothetical protein
LARCWPAASSLAHCTCCTHCPRVAHCSAALPSAFLAVGIRECHGRRLRPLCLEATPFSERAALKLFVQNKGGKCPSHQRTSRRLEWFFHALPPPRAGAAISYACARTPENLVIGECLLLRKSGKICLEGPLTAPHILFIQTGQNLTENLP